MARERVLKHLKWRKALGRECVICGAETDRKEGTQAVCGNCGRETACARCGRVFAAAELTGDGLCSDCNLTGEDSDE